MALLIAAEYKATMSVGMKLLQPEDVSHPVALGDYVRSIPEKDLDGHDFTSKEIVAVCRDPSDRWVHVLLKSASREVYLVIVVDQTRRSVHGHHLLDLHRLYGLDALSAD